MKTFFLFFFLLFYSLTFNKEVSANTIVYVDMNKIMNTSKPGLSMLKQLKIINKKNFDFYNNSEKTFKENEIKLLGKKKFYQKKNLKN